MRIKLTLLVFLFALPLAAQDLARSETALKDFAAGLQPLGAPQELVQIGQGLRGGMTLRRYRVKFPQKTLRITTFWMPDGKLEQFQIAAAE